MAAKMTEAEWTALKKKTGKREPQKVTTYYSENKREEEGLEHHKERREQNVAARNKQSGFIEGLKRKVAKKPDNQKITTHYKPTTPARKPEPKPSRAKRVVDTVNRGRSGMTSTVNEFSGFALPPAWMMGAGAPIQSHHSAPARRKRRKRSYDEPEQMAPMGMFDVPDHLKRFQF